MVVLSGVGEEGGNFSGRDMDLRIILVDLVYESESRVWVLLDSSPRLFLRQGKGFLY